MAVFLSQCFTNPIPNDPFYYPETDFLLRQAGPVIVGSGLCINYPGDLITAGTVTAICTDTTTGIITVPPGPITTCGTIALANTTVVPGTYLHASFTVDAQGRLTEANSNPAPIPCCAILAKGDILAGTAPATPTALPVGTNGQVLTACSDCSTGLFWAAPQTVACVEPVPAILWGGVLSTPGYVCTIALGGPFGSGNYPVEVTVDWEVFRVGTAFIGGTVTLLSSAGTALGGLSEFYFSGGAGIQPIVSNGSITRLFNPVAGATYCAQLAITCFGGLPTDPACARVAGGTIKEVH